MKESPNLDVLRSLAVLFVVLSHLRHFFAWGPAEAVYSLETLGRMGVAIFFVHTTLVLLMSLERHGPGAGAFLVRRFFRIYPLSIAVVLLIATVKWLTSTPVDTAALAANLLLVQNLTGHASTPLPLWSLPYEVQMYLLLPALYAMTRLPRPTLAIMLLCSGALAAAGFAWLAAVEFRVLRFVPCFLPGALAFVLGRGRKGMLSPLVLFGLVAVAVAAIPALTAAGLPELPLFWGLCLALGLVIPYCRPLSGGVISRCAKLIATYSYGIYLTHILALWLAFGALATAPVLVQWGMFVAMLAGLAYTAYRTVERPGIELGARLAHRMRVGRLGLVIGPGRSRA